MYHKISFYEWLGRSVSSFILPRRVICKRGTRSSVIRHWEVGAFLSSSGMEGNGLAGEASSNDPWFVRNETVIDSRPQEVVHGERTVMAISLTILAVIFTLGSVGNIMVCLVISMYAQMRTVFNILVLNLAVSDLFLGVIATPTYAARIIFEIVGVPADDNDGITVVCHISAFAHYVCTAQSLMTMTQMGIIRVVAVCMSSKRRRFRINKIIPCVLIALNYVASLTYAAFAYTTGTYTICMDLKVRASVAHRLSSLATLVGILILISMCYIWIFISTRKQSASNAAVHPELSKVQRPNRFDVATAKALLLVVGTYVVGYIPYVVFISLWAAGLVEDNARYMTIFPALTSLCSVANPIVYTHNSAMFRRQLRRLLRPG